MHFIIGDYMLAGGVGIIYDTTWGGVLTYLIFGIFVILAIIGLFTVIKWLAFGRRPKETKGQKWLRTGRMD